MSWRVPLSDLELGAEEKQAVTAVLESRWLSLGQKTRQFEQRFAAMLGVRYAIAVCNGTAALHLAHKALGLGPGDEAICPSLTFVAGPNAIRYCGAECVFADIISEDDLTICPRDIERKLTPRTRVIQVMHYGGYPSRMPQIMQLAREKGLAVIEDCAHAPGAELNGIPCGTWGDVGCFSFFSNKNLTTAEGGMVVTNDDELAERIRLMRSHGMTSLSFDRFQGHAFSYDVVLEGYNYRIDELRAALGLVQLGRLDDYNQKRHRLAEHYRRLLQGLESLSVPFANHPGRPSHHIFAVLLRDGSARPALMQFLKENGVQTSIHYPPVHRFQHYRNVRNGSAAEVPLTEDVARRLVTLPLYPAMRLQDVEFVVEKIRQFFADRDRQE